MEELKLIIEAIAGLPTMTVWVLCGFLVYKLAIVGSVYGVIRYAIEQIVRLHKDRIDGELRERLNVDITGTINGMCITADGTHTELLGQLLRLRGKGTGVGSQYIHTQSVEWLRNAIDDKEKKDYDEQDAKSTARTAYTK